MTIMGILVKQVAEEEVIIGYIFDIFAKYKPVILKDQLLQIVDIFMDTDSRQMSQDLQRCETLTKGEFIQLCKRVGLHLHHFNKISTLFDVEFGMTQLGPERELEVIRIALDGELDLKEHFQSKLAQAASGDTFYLLNKAFWQKWTSYVGLPRKDTFNSVQLERSASQVSVREEKARRPAAI